VLNLRPRLFLFLQPTSAIITHIHLQLTYYNTLHISDKFIIGSN